MENKKRILSLFFVMMLITLIGVLRGGFKPHVEILPTPSVFHIPQIKSEFDILWSSNNIYTDQDSFNPMMVASAGKVSILGNLTSVWALNITCLDGFTGNPIWQKTKQGEWSGSPNVLVSAYDGLYVGYSGIPSVTKTDLSTGNAIWSKSLDGRGLGYMFVQDKEVQVSTDPFIFTVLTTADGEMVRSMKGEDIFVSTPLNTVLPWGSDGIKAAKTGSDALLWNITLDDVLRLAPIFTDDSIYLRTGRVDGSVYALNRSSGRTLWKTDNVIVSNIAISSIDHILYVLTRNGELWGVNTDTGESNTLIEFSNVPFKLYGESVTGGYELAYDDSLGNLYVLFGDSRQLFAFKKR